MKSSSTAWIVVCAMGIYGGARGQTINSTEYETLPTDASAEPGSTAILFSGFFLPSTAPPTPPTTTLITDLPEQLQTAVSEEILTEQQPEANSVQGEPGTLEKELLFNNGTKNETQIDPVEENQRSNFLSVQKVEVPNVRNETSTEAVRVEVVPTEAPRRWTPSSPRRVQKDGQAYDLERRRLVEEHPCRRDCSKGRLMVCRYNFKTEWYESLSKACYNCPANITDCFRQDCIPADGFPRSLVVVNRRLPGPSIEVCLGDSVEILLENRLMSETTSVHWHGLHQRESPYMDGVPFVSQCPLLPRADFLYRYNAANTGTHFWHSHSGVQRADGMFGALVVRSGADPQRALYDEDLSEHLLQLVDWGHLPTVGVFTGHHHARLDNKPPTLLVNGRGIFAGAPPASFSVRQGKRYRFRLINAGVLNCPVELSIDNHTMLVISSDGSDIRPVPVDSLVSYAGERWDFVLTANASIGNYWMRFRGLMDCDQRFTSAHTVSVLHYINSSNELPTRPVGYDIGFKKGIQLNPLNEKESESSVNVNEVQSLSPVDRSLKPVPDKKVVLSYDFNRIDNAHFYKRGVYGFYQVADKRERVLTPQINHVSLALPPFPLLSQYADLKKGMLCTEQDLSDCSRKYCECLNVIELELGAVVELILVDIGEPYDANHPFHLHGHAFRVVAMDRIGNITSVDEIAELDRKGLIRRNLVDPPVKDTVTVADGGYTVVRFIADNPGYWMLHCHLEFHVELGMAVIFKVGEHSDFPPVPLGFPKCGNFISPPLTNENEVSWTYNSTKTPGSSFTLHDWWPLNKHTNASPQIKVSQALACIYSLIFFKYIF